MSEIREKKTRRTKPAFINSIISISLVLFILGLLTAFLLQAKQLSDYVKESIVLQLEMKRELSQPDVFTVLDQVKTLPYVKKAAYVSKDDAFRMLQEDIGTNAADILGENPLYDAINVNLNAEYANKARLEGVVAELQALQGVKAINYQQELVENVDTNVERLTYVLIGLAVLFLLLSIVIIDSTIRLAVFSQRFLIKSMQLVGATKGFIMKPFLIRASIHGLLAAFFASSALIGLFAFIENSFTDLKIIKDAGGLSVILAVVFLTGLLISLASTFMSVYKYLGKKVDELY